MPKDFEHLRTRLRIEQSRLLNWGEKIGLVEELLEHPSRLLELNQNLILDILIQVQAAFTACVKIESKFTEVLRDKANAPASLKSKHKKSFLRRTLALLENPMRISASLQWSMIKGEEFEGLIVKLIDYNDAVWSLLDRDTMHSLRAMQQQSNLIMLQLAGQVSELRCITAAMAVQSASVKNLSKISYEEEDSTHYSNLAALAAFKARQLFIEESSSISNELLIAPIQLPQRLDKSRSSELFEFGGGQAWMEWREPMEEDLDQYLLQTMEERVRKLAKLLSQSAKPEEFRAPRCLGYLCETNEADEPRYGFVFEVPLQKLSNPSEQRMSNLRHLFLTTPCPSLTKRIRLGSMIAESLFYLHAVNWLHKGLRSKSILFFTDINQKQTELSSPIISGFDFSRPDLPEEITVRHPSNIYDDLYRHPEHLQDTSFSRSRFHKSHDVYSLGIILIEIAFWKPIEVVMKIRMDGKSARSSVYKIQETILARDDGIVVREQTTMARLEAQVGEVYAKVVRSCMEGNEAIAIGNGIDVEETETDARARTELKMQNVFFEEILGKLQGLNL